MDVEFYLFEISWGLPVCTFHWNICVWASLST